MGHELEPKYITPEHYHAFGRIVQAFVAVEDFYTEIIGNIVGVDSGNAFFLLSNSSYDGVKNIIKTITSGLDIPEDQKKEGAALIDKVHDKATLRHNVAHDAWVAGKRPKSIKPIVLKAKGRLVAKGPFNNEKDWTAEELEAEANLILERALAVGMFFSKFGAYVPKQNGSH